MQPIKLVFPTRILTNKSNTFTIWVFLLKALWHKEAAEKNSSASWHRGMIQGVTAEGDGEKATNRFIKRGKVVHYQVSLKQYTQSFQGKHKKMGPFI